MKYSAIRSRLVHHRIIGAVVAFLCSEEGTWINDQRVAGEINV